MSAEGTSCARTRTRRDRTTLPQGDPDRTEAPPMSRAIR